MAKRIFFEITNGIDERTIDMKIQRVQFEKLFGFFDYVIDFHENITIIHGPNGCGKTTMLKIIDAVFNQKLEVLKTTDFQSVEFSFSNETILEIERKPASLGLKSERVGGIIYLAYTIIEDGHEQKFDSFEKSDEYITLIKKFLRSYRPFPFLEKISDDIWYDRKNDSNLTIEEVIAQYGPMIYKRYGRELFEDDIPEAVQVLLQKIDVRLITADRLTVQKKVENRYGEDSMKIDRRVNVIASNVSQKIRETIQEYAQLSQAKDRTFPLRAIKQNSPMTVDEIKEKMIQLEIKRKEFIDTGILEEEKDDIDIHELLNAITENNRQNLSLYAIDTEEKLNALSSLSSSINLFRNLIDHSFNNKKIVFNKDFGFRFITTYSGTTILPQNLSSGEQHELVMFYDLIFNTSENTLILIDEPELSLHIKWQINYVDELLSIIKTTGFYAALATHSPQIIHDKWNLTVSLSSVD